MAAALNWSANKRDNFYKGIVIPQWDFILQKDLPQCFKKGQVAIKWDYQQNLKSKEHKIFLQLSKSITKKPRKATMDTGAWYGKENV